MEDTTKYSDGYNYDSTRYNYVADVTVRPTVQTQTSYYNNDQNDNYPDPGIWDGYSKVVQDLLRDKFYTDNPPGDRPVAFIYCCNIDHDMSHQKNWMGICDNFRGLT